METPYTQGEWHVDGFDITNVIAEIPDSKMIKGIRYESIHGFNIALPFEERVANARLISKAPKLLKALKDLYMSVYGGNSVSIEDAMKRAPKTDKFEMEIIQLIKQAEGK